MINLDIQIKIWKKEALAHNYIGFLVVERESGDLDRIFIKYGSEYNNEINEGTKVIKQVLL